MSIKVDQKKCIGCGVCVGQCPQTFALNAKGKSEVISQQDIECARQAAQTCPTQAISVD
jgi:ferredoxin